MKIPPLYPYAHDTTGLDKTAQGRFKDGPKGIVIHFTAGGTVSGSIDYLIKSGLGYHILVERDGNITQMTSLDRMVWHAGKAHWGGYSPNKSFLSISLANWGKLTPRETGEYVSWSGKVISPENIRFSPSNTDKIVEAWEAATLEQEEALEQFCVWCIDNLGITFDNICGHDECALPLGRKNDPGGSIHLPMVNYRLHLAERWASKDGET